MTEARLNMFELPAGARHDQTWLDSKVMRRELTEDRRREGFSKRTEKASEAAESFLGDLNRRAEMRSGIERKSEEARKQQIELMRQKADEYRERLRSKMPPQVWDNSST